MVEGDLKLKHKLMQGSVFVFLRGTFYRWAALWQETVPDLAKAPRLRAVGDLHVENFGTWRDTEGRLIWGVNDFDEVARMPYAVDLVRLVTSAMFAKRENDLAIEDSAAADAVLEGYSASLESGGRPFVLEESHPDLRAMAMSAERNPVKFWGKLVSLSSAVPPKRIQRLLNGWLPDGAAEALFFSRIAGVGSLGRPRYIGIAQCNGGLAAREAKAWLPSAWGWANWPAEGPCFRGATAQAFGAAARPILRRQGWVGGAPPRSPLRENRARPIPDIATRKRFSRAMGAETANLPSCDARRARGRVARSRQAEAGLAA